MVRVRIRRKKARDPLYSIDTSALLDGAKRWYPIESFVTLWERLDGLIGDGLLISVDEVFRELERQKGDAIHTWCKRRKRMFWPLSEEIQRSSAEVLALFPRLVDTRRPRGRADPFVVGLARVTRTILITGEKKNQSAKRPKIPDACDHFKVKWIDLPTLIRERGWRF